MSVLEYSPYSDMSHVSYIILYHVHSNILPVFCEYSNVVRERGLCVSLWVFVGWRFVNSLLGLCLFVKKMFSLNYLFLPEGKCLFVKMSSFYTEYVLFVKNVIFLYRICSLCKECLCKECCLFVKNVFSL